MPLAVKGFNTTIRDQSALDISFHLSNRRGWLLRPLISCILHSMALEYENSANNNGGQSKQYEHELDALFEALREEHRIRELLSL